MLGDHIEPLVPGDLVLIGAQLPHIYQNDQVGGGRTPRVYAVLVQFEENFLGGQVTEMAALQPVRRLLKRARLGLQIRGKTFPQFVNELRIGRACGLLTEDELTVTEVAYACGFRNLSNFNCNSKGSSRLRHVSIVSQCGNTRWAALTSRHAPRDEASSRGA